MDISAFLELVEKIPAAFWGVLFGSFFSILGVWLTNRGSEVRLENQFKHERFVKSTERELTLKKDIYLDAAEAVSAAISSLANFGNLEMSNEKVLATYSQKSPSLAKVHVVGTMPTVNALFDLINEHSKQSLDLWVTRHQLNAQKTSISNLDTQVAVFQRVVDKSLEEITQFNKSGTVDDLKWERLQKHVDFDMKRLNDGLKRRSELFNALANEHVAFFDSCSRATIEVSRYVVPLVEAIRHELELPLDLAGYQARVDKSLSQQKQFLDQYLSKVFSSHRKKPDEPEVEGK